MLIPRLLCGGCAQSRAFSITANGRASSFFLALFWAGCTARHVQYPTCPPGWTAGWGSKCMRLAGPASHEGCEAECSALDGSLACIQSQEDEDLATLITPSDPLEMVWVGEYQWPIEPNIEFRPLWFTQESINFSNPRDVAMGGQPGWGRCTNGETSNLTVIGSRTVFFQPNNWNGGEDCMARAASAGYLDNQCVEPYKCLCQWPGVTSDDFLEHGPVLTQRAKDAFSKQSDLVFLGITLSLVLGSVPAMIYMLVVEVWLIRYRQRTEASTQAEARLKIEQRRALRRRMLQSGLSSWIGFLLIACSIFPTVLNLRLIWPMYGFGTCPFGAIDYWSVLRRPELQWWCYQSSHPTLSPSDSPLPGAPIRSSIPSHPLARALEDGFSRAGWISQAATNSRLQIQMRLLLLDQATDCVDCLSCRLVVPRAAPSARAAQESGIRLTSRRRSGTDVHAYLVPPDGVDRVLQLWHCEGARQPIHEYARSRRPDRRHHNGCVCDPYDRCAAPKPARSYPFCRPHTALLSRCAGVQVSLPVAAQPHAPLPPSLRQ